ncbi:MAG: ADP-ribosylglycohydrolase family protein [Clostridia bacterium]|nr:ADP-ribosylglycohydrolase family protein [Clostridia bacterium]
MSAYKIAPDYSGDYYWDAYCKILDIELKQCIAEGLEIDEYKSDFEVAVKMPFSKEKADMADALFEKVINAEIKRDFKYNEPSDLAGIRALRKPYSYTKTSLTDEILYEKVKGGWYGRICGCLLGKPLEGIKTNELIPLLKETNNFPLSRYVVSAEITDSMINKFEFCLENKDWADVIECAPVDDDTTYTVLSQILIDRNGLGFEPKDVAKLWLQSQPIEKYFTAEKVAYTNFVNGYAPPYSAMYKNPYREWIGAQIRGDYFGYITPGNPELAAEYAFRDACISHIKNGIYGEMFVSAMISAAANAQSVSDVIKAGLAEIPSTSRLYEGVYDIINKYKKGVPESECISYIQSTFDEYDPQDSVHTITNALIVTVALLYGNGDFGKSICTAVQIGYDTDCNAATVGSVLGVLNGFKSIGEEWVKPLNNKLNTGITGLGVVEISELVEKTISHIKLKTQGV